MSRNLRGRVERLEKARPPAGGVNWANFCCGGPDNVVPDGSGIDWYEMYGFTTPGEERRRYEERSAAERPRTDGPPRPGGDDGETDPPAGDA